MAEIMIDSGLLESVKEIQNLYQDLAIKLGQLEIEKRILKSKENALDIEFQNINTKEAEVLIVLRSKYGDGTLNLDSGTFLKNP